MNFFNKLISLVLSLAGILYLAYFAFVNTELVYMRLPLLGEYKIPGTLSFISAFLVGVLFSCLFFAKDSMQKTMSLRKSRKELLSLKENQKGFSSKIESIGDQNTADQEPAH